jgi:hypothetical protein
MLPEAQRPESYQGLAEAADTANAYCQAGKVAAPLELAGVTAL